MPLLSIQLMALSSCLRSRTAAPLFSTVYSTMMMTMTTATATIISPLLIFKVSPDTHEIVALRQQQRPSSLLRHGRIDAYIHVWEVGVLHKCSMIDGSISWIERPISEISSSWLKDTLIQR